MTLLTPSDVADRLRIGLSTVYALLASGRLRGHRIGARGRGTYRVTEADLAAFLASTRTGAGAPPEPPGPTPPRPAAAKDWMREMERALRGKV